MKQRISADAETVRNPERSSDRRTIPAHPMGIIQQRPRGDAWAGDPWDHADWYACEWWRIRGTRIVIEAFALAKDREAKRPKER